MSDPNTPIHLEIPKALRGKLDAFRTQLRSTKIAEALLAGLFGLIVSYLFVFALDRIWDTPALVRGVVLLAGTLGFAILLPFCMHRWVWGSRSTQQVARILSRKYPRFGDRLLGVFELAENPHEDEQISPALCRAAISQVSREAESQDFTEGVPNPRHRTWGLAAGASLVLMLGVVFTAAGSNAFQRWIMPWSDIERYTFAQMNDLDDAKVVPYGEPFQFVCELKSDSPWKPETGYAAYGDQDPVEASLKDGKYVFNIPAQTQKADLKLSIRDYRKSVSIMPTVRPQLTALNASVDLPEYLQRAPQEQDLRNGTLKLLEGSSVTLNGSASRDLSKALVDGKATSITVKGGNFTTDTLSLSDAKTAELTWEDINGLKGKEPFVLRVQHKKDKAPTIETMKLNRIMAILDEEVLKFDVMAGDDFGIKDIGVVWSGIKEETNDKDPIAGEYPLETGAPTTENMNLEGNFSPKQLGIAPQPIKLQLYINDYLPGRERVLSPIYQIFVLDRTQHQMLIAKEFEKIQQGIEDIARTEESLHETNLQLQNLEPAELNSEAVREQLKDQADAEDANAAALKRLGEKAEDLFKDASRNPDIDKEALKKWTEMMETIKDVSENGMPAVSEKLNDSAESKGSNKPSEGKPSEGKPSEGKPSEGKPSEGKPSEGKPSEGKPSEGKPSEGKPDEGKPDEGKSDEGKPDEGKPDEAKPDEGKPDEAKPSEGKPSEGKPSEGKPSEGKPSEGKPSEGKPSEGKPSEGNPSPAPPSPPGSQQQKDIDDAIQKQKEVLAKLNQAQKEANETQEMLQGSTFVNRLREAAKEEDGIRSDMIAALSETIGLDTETLKPLRKSQTYALRDKHAENNREVSYIQDDLGHYYNRVGKEIFKTVNEDMKAKEVVDKMKELTTYIAYNQGGISIGHAQLWSKQFNEWADILQGPP